ncbi:Phosphatidylserine decarboxylase proenzyme [Rubripirellula obstinata]|uniref:phosphatidylserine decarboxylase n=1 Tax=Rubripirellula obstinata TaxID=406547 RepID=A0A5B1CMM4_9BACT|nr:archaetidylserine decarboxylase [Rubripirellula obstinata]KAA1262437.1 Phosphatidylserine decarboxylase proenzyme [Rubripirellula obstinata]
MDEILYHDRYLDKTCQEKVYGDSALRWTYGTLAGRISLNTVVKRTLFSHWYGWRMDRPGSREKIAPFIQEYGLDPDEFVEHPDQYGSFNEFFFRKLKPDARPIDADPNSAVFPADGRHLCVPDLAQCDGLFVKGQMFDLPQLLQDDGLAKRFSNGSLLLSRLCPVDYHRFHFPVAGTPGPTRLINGPLFSVNPIALRQNIHIFTENKRCVTELETDSFGTVLVMEIGATCVGGICQTYEPGTAVSKGQEKGFFRFGGSSTIMIFEPGAIRFDDDLIHQSSMQRELYAKIGDHMGTT